MKSLKILFLLTMLAALAITLSKGEFVPNTNDDSEADVSASEVEEPTSFHGPSRFLGHVTGRDVITCRRNPRLCYLKGSPGPDCCKNKCVNLLTDAFNCGRCGKKCSYKKICCVGKCVNPMTNEKHCGKCGSKCDKGSSCVYGMCSYA